MKCTLFLTNFREIVYQEGARSRTHATNLVEGILRHLHD